MNDVARSQLLELITDIWSKPEELALVHVSCKTTLIAVLEALLSFKEGLKIAGLDENDQQQIDMCKDALFLRWRRLLRPNHLRYNRHLYIIRINKKI